MKKGFIEKPNMQLVTIIVDGLSYCAYTTFDNCNTPTKFIVAGDTEYSIDDVESWTAGCGSGEGCCRVLEEVCFSNGTNKVSTTSIVDISDDDILVISGIVDDKGDDDTVPDSFVGEMPAAGYERISCELCVGCKETFEPFTINSGNADNQFSFLKTNGFTQDIYHPDDIERACEPLLSVTGTYPSTAIPITDNYFYGQEGQDGDFILDFSKPVSVSLSYWSMQAATVFEILVFRDGDTIPDSIVPGSGSTFITGATLNPDGTYTGGVAIAGDAANLELIKDGTIPLPVIWHNNNSTSKTTFTWDDTETVKYFLGMAPNGTGASATDDIEIVVSSYEMLSIGKCEEETVSGGGCCKQEVVQACYTNGTYTIGIGGQIDNSTTPATFLDVSVLSSDDPAIPALSTITEIPAGYKRTPCQYNTTSAEPNLPVRTCFWETTIDRTAENAILNTAAVNGHETITRHLYTYQQFENTGDAGGGVEGYHPDVTFDPDGLPEYAGEVTTTNISPSTAINEGAANGYLERREGYFYAPKYYHLGANAGKEIARFEIYDAYTSTTQSDRDEIFVSLDGVDPTMDRSDATSVAVGQAGTSFEIPADWQGQSMYMAMVHSDSGGASQVNWRANITLEDGTVLANQDLRDWFWNQDSPPPQIGTEQVGVYKIYDPLTAVTTWYDENGAEVQFSDLEQPLVEYECGQLPMSFNVTTINGITKISSPSGGCGGPYTYTFDGGRTTTASSTFDLGDTSNGTEPDIMAVRPAIIDSCGNMSAIESPNVVIGDPVDQSGTGLRIADTPNGANNNAEATQSENPDDPGGWVSSYGDLLFYDDVLNVADWDTTGAVDNNGGWLRFGLGTNQMGGMTAERCYPAGTLGREGQMIWDQQNVYYGIANSNINIKFEVVDQVTGTVLGDYLIRDNDNDPLGEADQVWAENTTSLQNDQTIDFMHTGNPICLRVTDTSTAAGDSTGHYWRFKDVELWDGSRQVATNHLWRVNNYIEARGIDADKSDPACVKKAIDDVSQADLIRITGNVVRSGTWDNGQDGWGIYYSLDGGPTQTAFEVDGNWDANNEKYTTPFTSEAIVTADADEIEIWWCIWGNGDSTEIARLYSLGFEEVNP